jgi:cytochrome c553
MKIKYSALLAGLILATALSACGKNEEAAAPSPAPAQPATEAPPPATAPTQEDAGFDPSATFASTCSKCHGAMGEGVGKNPKLSGLKRDEIAAKLKDYRDGKQVGPMTAVMAPNAKNLTDAQIDALAGYLGE